MGCGISRFGRNSPESDNLSSSSQSMPQPQPEGVNSADGVQEQEESTPPSPEPAPAAVLEREEIERIKVNQPDSKEDADEDNNKHGHEEADDSIFRYPRSPSFREYCTDPEIRFGVDSSPDSDDDDMDSHRTSRKVSKSTVSSPNAQDKLVPQSGLNGETEAKDDGKGRPSAFSSTGLKIRNVLGNKWGRSTTQGRSLRSYFQVSTWHRPSYFTKSSVAKAE
ncbi:uncharacterized protein LOC126799840 isoform X2 [Argentina anserina]|uniref:uncharacterized protein LOC126799840 isoform X2 n=1 Tax=Argentina anserina TaxID=57926 RepID=UPI00217632AD|nr:uncharacterized protein LOC126799840 isoform X2 [Potentilla anserina]